MTLKLVYEGVLVEMNKIEAPPFLLEDFNYLANKAVLMYINKRYNIYDISLQTTDDLRVLKSTIQLEPTKTSIYDANSLTGLYGATYEVVLPPDYLHILNCVCEYKMAELYKCYNEDDLVYFPARRLTTDAWSMVIINPYMCPMYKRPYFFIHNVNTSEDLPTNPYVEGTTSAGLGTGTDGELSRTITINGSSESLVEKNAVNRFGNASTVRLEIRYGRDDTVFVLNSVFIDYLKSPQYLRLTQDLLDLTSDTSQMMEFPDYVCQEIINELTHLLLELSSDPRLQTHIPISQSIANPAQASDQSKK